MNSHYLPRLLKQQVLAALADTPAVCLLGPRQVGKSTLAQRLETDRTYFTLDDSALLLMAKQDPVGFVNSLPERVIG